MDELFIRMEINLVHVPRMNARKVSFSKVRNTVTVKVICGGVHRIRCHIVLKKVEC